jgi:hypothetical protein
MVGGSLCSSTTKTGRHDIAEILLKVALNTINQIKSNRNCLIEGLALNINLLESTTGKVLLINI